MNSEQPKKGFFKKFPAQFWLVVMFEFFERGSYYGMMSFISVYFTDSLNIPKESVGVIKGVIQPLLYFLPIISGAIADRFGYRRVLMVAFVLLGGGYFLTSQATEYHTVFLALVIMGFGAGTFKPIISGTIAKITDESSSTQAFGIFYWSINLGAFLFPLVLVPYLKAMDPAYVIVASAICTSAMLIPTAFFFKEPTKQKEVDEKIEKRNQTNLIQTLANSFEIIYSPIVLIFNGIKRSMAVRIVVIAILGLLVAYSTFNYLSTPVVSEKFPTIGISGATDDLIFSVNRNMSKTNDYNLKSKEKSPVITLTVASADVIKEKIPEIKSMLAKYASFGDEQKKGFDAFLEGFSASGDSTYKINKTQELVCKITEDPATAVPVTVQPQEDPKTWELTIYKPKNIDAFAPGLIEDLKKYANFENITKEGISEFIKQSDQKMEVVFQLDSGLESDFKLDEKENSSKLCKVYIKDTDNFDKIKDSLMAAIHTEPVRRGITAKDCSKLNKNLSEGRPFFVFFVISLIILGLIITAVSSGKKSDASEVGGKSGTWILLIAMIIGIWLLPGIAPLGKIIGSIIYLSIASLFIIDKSDSEKFVDHFKFLLMIVLYSGFWILYFQMFDSVLWYVKAYVNAESLNNAVNSVFAAMGSDFRWFFDVEHVTVINAGTIILLQLLISNIVKNKKAMPTLITGITIATIGMAMLAVSTGIWIFMLGIVLFSIGEMTAHPKFISYIGLIAPSDKKAMYMGYLFLYGVFGSSVGGVLGAKLYVYFVDNLNQPRTLWLIFSGIGIVSIISLLLYNKFLAPKKTASEI